MYLPVNAAITATGLLAVSKFGTSNLATNELSLPTSSAALVARQDDNKPPDLVTSIQFVTSIAFITSEPTPTATATSPPPPTPSTTAKPQASSEQPSPKTSATTLASSTSSTTGTSTTTATTTPTQTSHPDSDNGPWISRGKIAGIVVGSVLGLIILCLIIYTLFAFSRGINVCDCFGGCCGKHNNKDEEKNNRDRLPSRSENTYPHPHVLAPGPEGGYRAYRPARLVSHHQQANVPLPLVLPQQVETQERRSGRLQRGYRGA